MDELKKYQPKGSMCIVCIYRNNSSCAELNFYKMPTITSYKKDNTIIKIVKCTKFNKEK